VRPERVKSSAAASERALTDAQVKQVEEIIAKEMDKGSGFSAKEKAAAVGLIAAEIVKFVTRSSTAVGFAMSAAGASLGAFAQSKEFKPYLDATTKYLSAAGYSYKFFFQDIPYTMIKNGGLSPAQTGKLQRQIRNNVSKSLAALGASNNGKPFDNLIQAAKSWKENGYYYDVSGKLHGDPSKVVIGSLGSSNVVQPYIIPRGVY